jgi:isoleucyl-tRNA synthetase
VILDATGQKLSKRLNNYADPLELFDKYGSDALRVTMLSAGVVKGQELLIDKDGKMVFDSLRLFIKPIWNAFHFFCLYANADGIKGEINYDSKHILDRYILSKLKVAVQKIEKSMDAFDTQIAYQAITDFFEVLNNWYIRRSRSRFWKAERDEDKVAAYNSLYTCLIVMMESMSSLMPLISEHIYLALTDGKKLEDSVHLRDFPNLDKAVFDQDLVIVMDQILDICSSGLFIRNTENIRVRQPLASLKIISHNSEKFKDFEDLIKDEINVKEIEYSQDVTKYADLKLSINFQVLGKRLPEKMKDIIAAQKQGQWKIESEGLFVAGIKLSDEEYSLALVPKETKGTKALSSNRGIIILDLAINKELEEEGIARDLVRLVQQMRKDSGFDVSDRIQLSFVCDGFDLEPILQTYENFICEQTLSILAKGPIEGGFSSKAGLGEHNVMIGMKKSDLIA